MRDLSNPLWIASTLSLSLSHVLALKTLLPQVQYFDLTLRFQQQTQLVATTADFGVKILVWPFFNEVA